MASGTPSAPLNGHTNSVVAAIEKMAEVSLPFSQLVIDAMHRYMAVEDCATWQPRGTSWRAPPERDGRLQEFVAADEVESDDNQARAPKKKGHKDES